MGLNGKRRSDGLPNRKRNQCEYPLTHRRQSRIGKDFQKFCWSKWKIFREYSFLVMQWRRKCYAIDISAGQKIFLGGCHRSRLIRQYVCIRKKRTLSFFDTTTAVFCHGWTRMARMWLRPRQGLGFRCWAFRFQVLGSRVKPDT